MMITIVAVLLLAQGLVLPVCESLPPLGCKPNSYSLYLLAYWALGSDYVGAVFTITL